MTVWPVVHLSVPESANAEAWDILCALLLEAGCEGFEERDPRADEVPGEAILYFQPADDASDEDGERCLELVSGTACEVFGVPRVSGRVSFLREEDWGAGWKPFYHATEAVPGLWVGPPEEWEATVASNPGCIYVKIEYSQAFGTGGHPTTRGCLRMLSELRGQHASILDIGTGTGVLCFGAIALGASEALGMDVDPKAGESFHANAQLNGMSSQVVFVEGSMVDEAVAGCLLNGMALPDLVICNMLSVSSDALLEPLARLRRPVVLSGFLEAEAVRMRGRLLRAGFVVERETGLEEWGTWLCRPVDAGETD